MWKPLEKTVLIRLTDNGFIETVRCLGLYEKSSCYELDGDLTEEGAAAEKVRRVETASPELREKTKPEE